MAKKRRNRGTRHHRVVSAPRAGGGRALEVDGVVQSVTVDLAPIVPGPATTTGSGGSQDWGAPTESVGGGYWELLLPERCPRRALIVGLGGGTVAALLARRCPGVVIVGIERDETVLALARAEFGLDDIPRLSVVVADAFAEVATRAEREPGAYDYICLDLYEGGRLTPGTLATAFLRQLAALLTPEGTLAVNLLVSGRLSEQLHRLRRVFDVEREMRARGNLVAHARLPARGEMDLLP